MVKGFTKCRMGTLEPQAGDEHVRFTQLLVVAFVGRKEMTQGCEFE